ncbi:hypothetical protein DRF58_12110 [Epilithonimonas hispanica]|uniref:PRTase-CE domain-containing protein n=2 Tax=Epilithonimonas hispanica TaxID=358687 RepID=A0A3D9CVA1_9FLAO|nr:hypothetical protein DRF58_12110 [Epilithonimonas hispanica]
MANANIQNRMKNNLELLLKFQSIFEEKSWSLIDGYDEKLDRFGLLIDNLAEEEINLLLELTHLYEWMSYNDYHNNLRSLLKQVLVKSLPNKSRLLIFPIIKPTDESEVKSGHVVMKMMESIKPSINGFKGIEIKLLKEFRDLRPERLEMSDNDFLILVDDYIGSGKTLNKTLLELNKNPTVGSKFAIVSMVIQDQAKLLLEENNISHYYSVLLKKGISDNNNSPHLEKKLELMRTIENKIPKVSRYRLGYEKSEALITLMRTPNNTFPIFWKGIITKGGEIDAPFQRY